MQKYLLIILILAASLITAGQHNNIIPQPAKISIGTGFFDITKETVVVTANPEDRKAAIYLRDYLKEIYGLTLDIDKKEGKNYIRLLTKTFIQAPGRDAYTLTTGKDGIRIEGDTYAGTFYGMQSLIQLLPVGDKGAVKALKKLSIPRAQIQDVPRFEYRGMHLDVGRHFFPVSFVKRYIDYLALHKMNYFHWHLTEDQGWRIEIKKYPLLTEIGGFRNGTIIGRYPGRANDSARYGGFYTQEQIKEVVQYATDRHVTVIPEIEMPGHSSAALLAYPSLGCPGTGPYKVEETWGVFEDIFCAGNDSTFLFLQDVLDEVLTLFPSKYIHVGGDEAPKNNWKKCSRCQERIKANNLKDEHGLQSYFIQRMEKYINGKGRRLIGWDEILEGGLAPNAVVMSWRGEEGGITAAKENHNVIMTPGNFVYFDHAQSRHEDSVTIGNYTPVQETYSYEPIPKELDAEHAKYILGSQANVWTEYMRYPSKVEYMIFPRMSALSEVLWTPKEKKSWPDFERRLQTQFQRYDLWKTNWSKAYYDVNLEVAPAKDNKGLVIKLSCDDKTARLMYGITGKHFAKNYTAPLAVTENSLVTGLVYKGNKMVDSVSVDLKFSKSTGKSVTLVTKPATNYPGEGAFTLVNGVINEHGLARSKEFLGYRGEPMQAVIDLGARQDISNATIHAIITGGSRVYPPESAEVLISPDGKNFTSLALSKDVVTGKNGKATFQLNFPPASTRYIKVVVSPVMKIADGKSGAGETALMFIDEIQIN